MSGLRRAVGLIGIVLLLLVGGLVGSGVQRSLTPVALATSGSAPAAITGQPLAQTLVTPAATTGGLPDIVSVAARVRPATVLVSNIVQGRSTRQNPTGGEVPQGAGTGFIIDAAGYIVTNAHVVAGAQKLTVQLPPPDGRTFDATLVGTSTINDLAVLKINASKLPTVALGTSGNLQVGEWVVAIGNALALEGGPTVTTGVVSATGRDAQEPGAMANQAGPTLYDLIQTDAAINPGNSGGPLVNMNGEVIGINTLGTTAAQGIGFAISIDTAKPIIQQLIQTGSVSVPYLGVANPTTVTQSVAAANNLPRNDGVYIPQVLTGTPAAQAGLQQGDIIFAINNQAVTDTTTFQKALLQHKAGEAVTLKGNRGGKEMTLTVTLAERSQATVGQAVS